MYFALKNRKLSITVFIFTLIVIFSVSKGDIRDYEIYKMAYGNADTRFEPVYQALSDFSYNADLIFENFYISLILLEILLFFYVLSNLPRVYIWLLLPSLLTFGVPTFIEQIRFGISILFIMIGILQSRNIYKIIFYLIAIGFHYFAICIILINILSSFLKIDFKYKYLLISIQFLLSALLKNYIEFLASYFGYQSYIGSEFFDSKSIASEIYTFIVANFLIISINQICYKNKIIIFYFLCILAFFATSSLAVISGRFQIFIFFFEPLLCAYLIYNNMFISKYNIIILTTLIYLKLIYLL